MCAFFYLSSLESNITDRLSTGNGQGRLVPSHHGQEAPPRAGDRSAEPPPVHLPRCVAVRIVPVDSVSDVNFRPIHSRVGRRGAPAPEGRLPRPRALWSHLLQHGAHERRRDPVRRPPLYGARRNLRIRLTVDGLCVRSQLAVVHGISVAGGACVASFSILQALSTLPLTALALQLRPRHGRRCVS